jgi:hypothetical protein
MQPALAPATLLLSSLLSLLLLASCAPSSSVQRSGPGLTRLDKEAQYVAVPTERGILLTLYVDRYQFVPNLPALGEHCTARFLALAQELGTQQGHTVAPLDAGSIQRTVTRDGVRGITSCTATGPVLWKE